MNRAPFKLLQPKKRKESSTRVDCRNYAPVSLHPFMVGTSIQLKKQQNNIGDDKI